MKDDDNGDDDYKINDDMRVVITGSATVLEEYALSKHFDWHRDKEILRPIVQNVAKLLAILNIDGRE